MPTVTTLPFDLTPRRALRQTVAGQSGGTDPQAARQGPSLASSLLCSALNAALAASPLLGYVTGMLTAAELALKEANGTALLSVVLGHAALLCADKLVRPLQPRGGIELPFHWVLAGCAGGLAALGLAGVVIGPAVLGLAGDLWRRCAAPVASAR